jgi:hypothetical protein
MPIDLANLGVAKLTQGLADALPSFPAARPLWISKNLALQEFAWYTPYLALHSPKRR